jgi:MFS family permease
MTTPDAQNVQRPATSDRTILYAAAFLRALATGMLGVLLGIYLAKRGLPLATSGFIIAAGLAGAATATLIATVAGDRLGRRRFLIVLSLIGAAGAVAASWAASGWAIGIAAFIGMLNGMGRDRGAALALEQAVLPTTAPDADRTQVIAWYNVLQDAGHATGSLLAGLPVWLRAWTHASDLDSLRATLWVYAGLCLVACVLYVLLTPGIETHVTKARVVISPESRRLLTRISALFAIDSLGGGFLTTSLLSLFFFERFHASEATIGMLFFGARLANAASHVVAAWLARRIGLVNTMVFTHIPSSLLLATVGFAPNFSTAAVLFLLREGLVEMDVPTRQSYVMAVVRPEERTFASGVTHLVRMGAWAVAPSFAGLLMQWTSMALPLFIGAGMKITYDVLLYGAFKRVRPPEESRAPAPTR